MTARRYKDGTAFICFVGRGVKQRHVVDHVGSITVTLPGETFRISRPRWWKAKRTNWRRKP